MYGAVQSTGSATSVTRAVSGCSGIPMSIYLGGGTEGLVMVSRKTPAGGARECVGLLVLPLVNPLDGVACEVSAQLVHCLAICRHGGGDGVAGASDLPATRSESP